MLVHVMCFNLRYGKADDGDNAWPHRRDAVAQRIIEVAPDVLGVQECLDFQADFLRERLHDYEFVGVGRDNGQRKGEMAAIFYRRERFDLANTRHVWLSETPGTPGSRGWDAALPRMATCITLTDRDTQRRMTIINTHFDHRGRIAQVESAKLLLSQLDPATPTILMGDLNCVPDSEPYRTIVEAGLRDARRAVGHDDTSGSGGGGGGTFHDFRLTTTGPRIDFIFVSPHWTVMSEMIDHTAPNGRPLSDHFPILATLKLGE